MKNYKPWWELSTITSYTSFAHGDLVQADALKYLECLKDECADIIFLDPPFNLGKTYGKNSSKADRLDESDYLAYLIRIISRCATLLKPGGALYFYHIPKWAIKIAPILNDLLVFRHWIAISMKNGFVRGKSLYPAHYALLYFTKGLPAVFTRPKIPALVCRHCNGYVRDYGGYKEFIKNGINLSDIWDDLSPVRHKKYKHRNSNELPIELLNRIIKISGVNRGLIVDPFAGTGTTAIAGLAAGMNFSMCDLLSDNFKIIKNRVLSFQSNGEDHNNG